MTQQAGTQHRKADRGELLLVVRAAAAADLGGRDALGEDVPLPYVPLQVDEGGFLRVTGASVKRDDERVQTVADPQNRRLLEDMRVLLIEIRDALNRGR